jgi:hypothetical protein
MKRFTDPKDPKKKRDNSLDAVKKRYPNKTVDRVKRFKNKYRLTDSNGGSVELTRGEKKTAPKTYTTKEAVQKTLNRKK